MPLESHVSESCSTQVCVIGSGPAGGFVAVELAKKGVQVLLLEKGGELLDQNKDSISEEDSDAAAANLRFGWSKELGGSSNLWAGRTCPLESIDFEERAWINDSGWPFSYDTLEPFYRQAADILKIPSYESFFDNSHISGDFPLLPEPSFGATDLHAKCFLWAAHPFNVSDYLKDASKIYPSLQICLNSSVTKLIEKTDGSGLDSVEVTSTEGRNTRIKADYFILACGGLEIPRLMLNSRDVRAHGVGNDHDVVGRYFSTHPKADMAAVIFNRRQKVAHPLFSDQRFLDGSIRYGIGLSAQAQCEHELLNHYVQFSPILEYQANRAFEVVKNTKALDYALIDERPLIQGVLPGIGKIAYEMIGRMAGLQPKAKKFILRGFLDQFPDKDNRVMLSDCLSPDGTHKTKIKWRFTERDKDSVLRFFEILDLDLRARNIGKVEYSALKEKDEWPIVGVHSHFMGTTRMGSDPRTSVTNSDGRVHGYHNLYVSGPSLFPTFGYANPFLTISALSIRLSRHLLSELK